ncbi:hypothetical protein [Deinococcus sp. UYEF24]
MAEPRLSWDAARFDSGAPTWCPEVQRWTDVQPRDTSWGYVFDPQQPDVRQHIRHDDWIVWFADGRIRVMTSEQFDAFHVIDPNSMAAPQE